jgi:hypothetical protein
VVNVPVTITPPAGPTLLEQRWRDARVAVLDKEHPTAINTSSPYVS